MKNRVDLTVGKAAEYAEKNGISLKGRILVGLSGGADSVSLLHILLRLGAEPVCVHVNHMIRGADADRDEEFCRALCEKLAVEFHSYRVNVPELAKSRRAGLEETARDERRRIFKAAEKEYGCESTALAHNADDRAETFLFNLARGAGTKGLGSIRPVRREDGMTLIRPLLCLTKAEILAFLSAVGEDHVTDSTNDDTDYTRNYIRHELLPLFGRINPAYLSNINKAADSAAEVDDLITETANRALNGASSVSKQELAALEPAVSKKVLSLLYEKQTGQSLSDTHLQIILGFADSAENGKRLCLPDNCDLVCDNGHLRFTKRTEPAAYDFRLAPGRNDVPGKNCVFFLESSDDLGASDAYINIYKLVKRVKINSAIIEQGVYVKNRSDGDTIFYGGMTHSVKKLLSQKKIPSSERACHPVVYDKDGILFVPPGSVRDGIRGDGAVCLTYFEY